VEKRPRRHNCAVSLSVRLCNGDSTDVQVDLDGDTRNERKEDIGIDSQLEAGSALLLPQMENLESNNQKILPENLERSLSWEMCT
jgi:hypothetical protein